MPSITIDGIALDVAEGSTILDAARVAGIRIPTLCFLKERSAIASCRVCVVDVEGLDQPVPSCATPVQDGMKVTTSSPRVEAYRRIALELIIADHGLDSTNYCFSCDKNGASISVRTPRFAVPSVWLRAASLQAPTQRWQRMHRFGS